MRLVPAKRKIKIVLTTVAFLLASFFWSFPLTQAAESNCVKCHTSEKLLKALHKPAKVAVETGEG